MKPGIVRFGYYQFAVFGPESEYAAHASECAGDQQAFWPYHDRLYASQKGENQGAFSKEKLKSMAAELQLEATAFSECMDSAEYAKPVTEMTNFAQSLGIRATPTFLVNGRAVQGALPIEQFRQIIEDERAKLLPQS